MADTFTESFAKLNGTDQRSVETTAFDLRLNPTCLGMSFLKLDKAKDKTF